MNLNAMNIKNYLKQEFIDLILLNFKKFDKEGKGAIPSKDLGMILQLLGYNPTKRELNEMMDILEEVVPDVIRLSGTHVAKFLPFLCSPSCARYIIVEPPCVSSDVSSSRLSGMFCSSHWERVAPARHMSSRRTLLVAEQI